jgi:ribonuclease HI
MSTRPHFFLFGDGSSSRGDDIGAWASIAVTGDNSKTKLLWGIDYPTTISRVELRPIIEGLRWIKANWAHGQVVRVEVWSDSQYTIRTLAGEYPRSQKNRELWVAVDEASKGMQVTYRWRERNSTDYMTFADGLCGPLRRMMINHMSTVARDPRNPEADMPVLELPRWDEPLTMKASNETQDQDTEDQENETPEETAT